MEALASRLAVPGEQLRAIARGLAERGERLLQRLGLAGLAVAMGGLLLATVSLGVVDGRLTQLSLDLVAARAADEVQLGLVGRVEPADFEPPFVPERLDDFGRRLEPVVAHVKQSDTGVLRVNVIARDGTIIYSDRARLRGQVIPPSDKSILASALSGSVGAGRSALRSVENVDLRREYNSALEVYVPVRLDGRTVGAYEIYQDIGPLRGVEPLLWTMLLVVWLTGLVGGLWALSRRREGGATPGPAAAPSLAVAVVPTDRPARHVRLTPRELEVLRLMATTHTNREIAQQLVISDETVRSHVKRILRKLGQPDRTQAVLAAVNAGLIELADSQQPTESDPNPR